LYEFIIKVYVICKTSNYIYEKSEKRSNIVTVILVDYAYR